MCGIVGIISKHDVVEKIVSGLEMLEYRGYDSAGVAVIDQDGVIDRVRAVGKLQNLKSTLNDQPIKGFIGIGHTRWATHGKATVANSHPILSKTVCVVHNGIIENCKELKFELQKDGYQFLTDTDTEVVAHLLQQQLDRGKSPREAFRYMLATVSGTYAFAVLFESSPHTLFVARRRSPLVLGFGEDICVASDTTALSGLSQEVIYLDDNEYAEISLSSVEIFNGNYELIKKDKVPIPESTIHTGKGGYDYYMLKEIMEQGSTLRQTMQHLSISDNLFDDVSRILILACGTSYYAGMTARYWFEEYLHIPTDVEIASEYRYRKAIVQPNTLVVVITQSGETIDTLEALDYVRSNYNCRVLAISNVKNSAVSRMADYILYTDTGTEVGVASTKTFTAQLAVLASMAVHNNEFLLRELRNMPLLIEEVLSMQAQIKSLASSIVDVNSVLFLGRSSLYPIALEGALKLKEVSYIHAEGFAAGEIKHGPIALIDDTVPVICLCPYDSMFEKMSSNIQVALARGKRMLILTDAEGATRLPGEITKLIVPSVHPVFSALLYVIPLQMLAYYTALMRGNDVDKPRNLAKSVTVE